MAKTIDYYRGGRRDVERSQELGAKTAQLARDAAAERRRDTLGERSYPPFAESLPRPDDRRRR